MVILTTDSIEFRVMLKTAVDYFDIIPQLEMEFRSRFILINNFEKNYLILFRKQLISRDDRTSFQEFCKTKLVDWNYYIEVYNRSDKNPSEYEVDENGNLIKVIYGYENWSKNTGSYPNEQWQPITKNTTWYELYKANNLHPTTITYEDLSVINFPEINKFDMIILNHPLIQSNFNSCGWYYNKITLNTII